MNSPMLYFRARSATSAVSVRYIKAVGEGRIHGDA